MKQRTQSANGRPNRNGERSLAIHSPTNETSDPRAILEGQLRECFGRVVFSHKTHEKCADILLSRLSGIKFWQIALSAITTAGCIAVVFGVGKVGALVSVIVSTTLLAINMYTKDYDLGEIAQRHRQAGADLWKIREKYLSLITDLRIGEESIDKLQVERDNLLEELHAIYSGAPSTTYKAYKKAQEALKKLEDMTFSDEEIDSFLPEGLKKVKD